MKIGKKFNQLLISEYKHYIDNYKKYKDFNTLGLYRSLIENEKIRLSDKIELRDYANKTFMKTYNFLQLKDPYIFFKLETLGLELTVADERQFWENIRKNQEKILSDKKIKHRNFGTYSIHDCGYELCPYNGLMIKQGSILAESQVHFNKDQNKYEKKLKAQRMKKQRKNKSMIIKNELKNE